MKKLATHLKPILPMSMTAVITFILFVFAIILSSCTGEDAVLESADIPMERIDLEFEGAAQAAYFLTGETDPLTDLVAYRQFSGASRFDILLHLDDQTVLEFKITDELNAQPWTAAGQSYSVYPDEDLEDKQQYVHAELHGTGEVPEYMSHSADAPAGILVSVFRVVEYNPVTEEVLCRIAGLPLFKSGYPDEIIRINGTFRGSVAEL